MSGLVGHSLYAILALQQAEEWTPSLVPLLKRHFGSYLAGAYIGADIQMMPEAVCVQTGKELGIGTVPLTESPFTGGPVRPWYLEHAGNRFRPNEIHRLFYGRSHLIFGWTKEMANLRVSWDLLVRYAVCVIKDYSASSPTSDNGLAWIFGWLVHVVSDSMIKSRQPGLKMHLVDGLYTARNRPIQDLFAFYEMGVKELKIDWKGTFALMAQAPIEAVQFHYMRIRPLGPHLSKAFADGWAESQGDLLQTVLRENRRWLSHHAGDVLAELMLEEVSGRRLPSKIFREWTQDSDYGELMAMAEKAGIRDVLRGIVEETVGLFDHVLAEL